MLRNIFGRNNSRNNPDNSHNEVTFNRQFYDQFWNEFHNHLIQNKSVLVPFSEAYNFNGQDNRYTYAGIHFGEFDKDPIRLIGWTDVNNGRIAAKLRFKNLNPLFGELKEDQESIHAFFGGNLEWDRPPSKSVGLYRSSVDFGNTSNHEELFEWLRENLEKLERVFMWKLTSYYIDNNWT
ncbi:MAG: DUF4268 domain-containing protein [Candidatus Poribacteria bacterium]|nr:DUF4268 domain-containing protein [Candidatus Poribacteria bacterium]